MTTYKAPTDLDRAALRAMGHSVPAGCDQQGRLDARFRKHEGDDYPITDEDRQFRALWWRVGIAVTLSIWGVVVLAVWPN